MALAVQISTITLTVLDSSPCIRFLLKLGCARSEGWALVAPSNDVRRESKLPAAIMVLALSAADKCFLKPSSLESR